MDQSDLSEEEPCKCELLFVNSTLSYVYFQKISLDRTLVLGRNISMYIMMISTQPFHDGLLSCWRRAIFKIKNPVEAAAAAADDDKE